MRDVVYACFADPLRHEQIAQLIRRVSSNRSDVRDTLLSDIDVSRVRRVLDLGCGFGFMARYLAPRVAPDATFTGIDACEANRDSFLASVTQSGRGGDFFCACLNEVLDWPDGHFDLVVASYSLYYFADLVPDIARVLSPHGLFVTTTHTRRSCSELLRALDLHSDDAEVLKLADRFSAEHGAEHLGRYFAEVERVDFVNSLVFDAERGDDDWLAYVRFKLPLLLPTDGLEQGTAPAGLLESARAILASEHRIVIDKSDTGFRCRRPRCQ
jgi:SAM-dependent methyltransferase